MTEAERAHIIVERCGGIHPPMTAFYITSIMQAAQCSIMAFNRFADLEPTPDNAATAFVQVQEALSHAAALSRFFWPPRSKQKDLQPLAEKRAERLRRAFQLNDASALKFRGARDALDHFEERLDKFLLWNDSGHFVPQPLIGPVELAEAPAQHIFKLVDPEAGQIVILGEAFDFRAIMVEVEIIHTLACQFYDNGCVLPSEAK